MHYNQLILIKIGKYISFKEVLNNFKNEHNIFLTNNFKTNELLNKKNYSLRKDDYLVTLFDFKDKEIILKSYLVNNNKIQILYLIKIWIQSIY
jgi:hypothetical protein